MKFLIVLLLLALAWRLFTGRWPLQRKPARSGTLADHRQALARARSLLELPEGAGRQEIAEAHRRMLARVHPDRGGSSDQVHEVNAARDLLLADLSNPS